MVEQRLTVDCVFDFHHLLQVAQLEALSLVTSPQKHCYNNLYIIYMYMSTCTYIDICTHTYIYTYINMCIYIQIIHPICIYTQTHTYIYLHIYVNIDSSHHSVILTLELFRKFPIASNVARILLNV